MDLIMAAKVRPVKVPNPSTKKDGRKEVRIEGAHVHNDIEYLDVPLP